LLHEVINTIYNHPLKDEFIKSGLTFGIIPSGTSNGLVKSISH